MLIVQNRYFIVPTRILLGFCHLLILSSLSAQTDSIANERIPVRAEQLEAHWAVDCAEVFIETQRILASGSDLPEEKSPSSSDIKKCIYIYNTPDSAHYKPNPDYKQLLEKLEKISQ